MLDALGTLKLTNEVVKSVRLLERFEQHPNFETQHSRVITSVIMYSAGIEDREFRIGIEDRDRGSRIQDRDRGSRIEIGSGSGQFFEDRGSRIQDRRTSFILGSRIEDPGSRPVSKRDRGSRIQDPDQFFGILRC